MPNVTCASTSRATRAAGRGDRSKLAKYLAANPKVAELNLNENNMGDQGAEQIADALKTNTTLRKLELGLNYITDVGAKSLLEALEAKQRRSSTSASAATRSSSKERLRKKAPRGAHLEGRVSALAMRVRLRTLSARAVEFGAVSKSEHKEARASENRRKKLRCGGAALARGGLLVRPAHLGEHRRRLAARACRRARPR